MKSAQIILFEMTASRGTSWLIAAVTRSMITHAAVVIDGKCFDASESRGDVDEMDVSLHADRMCYVIDADVNQLDLFKHLGKRYDWHGVFGWLVCRYLKKACGKDQSFYCFEFAHLALTGDMPEGAVSGRDLINIAHEFDMPVRYVRFGDLSK